MRGVGGWTARAGVRVWDWFDGGGFGCSFLSIGRSGVAFVHIMLLS